MFEKSKYLMAAGYLLPQVVFAAGIQYNAINFADASNGTTYLVDLQQGAELSNKVNSMRNGGFETSMGRWVSFNHWYSTKWVDSKLLLMTQVTPSFGILWGGSTGERGEKYSIAPSLKMGFVYQKETQRNHFLSIRAVTTVGGELKERGCLADYGDIGGSQYVNCRLAASPLPPSETLRYLVNSKPLNKDLFFIQYSITFN